MQYSTIFLSVFLVLISLFIIFWRHTNIAIGVTFAALLISAVKYSTGSHELAGQISIYAFGALAVAAIIGLANNLDDGSRKPVKIHVKIPSIFKGEFKILSWLVTAAFLAGAITYSSGLHELANKISIFAYTALVLGTIIMLIHNLKSGPEEDER